MIFHHLDDVRSLLFSKESRRRRRIIDSKLHAIMNHENREESWEEESTRTAPSQMTEDDDYDDNDEDLIVAMAENDEDDEDDKSLSQEINGDDDDEGSSPPILVEEYRSWSDALLKAQKALQKKQTSLQNELQKVQQVESTVARAQLLTTYLYKFNTPEVKSCVVQDWENDGRETELTLDPAYESASAEADALFQQARKLKRGSAVVKTLQQETTQAVEMLKELQTDLDSVLDSKHDNGIDEDRLRLVQDRLLRTSRVTNFQPPTARSQHDPSAALSKQKKQQQKHGKKPSIGSPESNIRKLQSPAGCTILVGRNRRGNEYLSTVVARDKDIWMHARGTPGAHVVLLQRRGSAAAPAEATADCWQLAANLAAFYSDHRSERKTAVSAVQPKHIIKPRNAPLGAVKVREEWKVLTGFPDDVPDELKRAREASGQLEDYRAADKAKLRKRNKRTREKEKSKAKTKKKKQQNS